MQQTITRDPRAGFSSDASPYEPYAIGISWAAVIGGAFVAASLSLILLALGTGQAGAQASQ